MLRFITKLLPRRKTLLVLLVLLAVSLLQHTLTPTTALRTSKTSSQKNALLAQLPLQTGHALYKHSDKGPTDKNDHHQSTSFVRTIAKHLTTPVEYKLFDWHTLLHQGTLHKRDYA